ncbi:ABC transporter permease [Actinomyces ruminicola]|uniref:ABC-2 type transport system permease protein n=1 Tax=Actinomyces ruminicola TaxID=332524 RepID=A0A1G9YYB9_9ACTO|nr:ABC transporter permease [Actinomyces ruminicola]SDN14152.1 ABC-2 type transport system permease protein [Actinomyces ruminicola]
MSTTINSGALRSARPLTITHWREMSRNRTNFYFVLIFPFALGGMFLGMNKILHSTMSGPGPDFSAMVIPIALCMHLTGTCMTLTAGPIAEYRQYGTLRILGTTPVSRGQFILTHLAVRVLLAIALSALIGVLGALLGISETAAVWRAVLVALPSSVLFLALGYFIGSLVGSGQAATNIATFTGLFFVFTSGAAFPLELLSDSAKRVLDFLPTSYFGDLLFWVTGGAQRYETTLDFAVLTALAIVAVPLAVKTFRWEAANN